MIQDQTERQIDPHWALADQFSVRDAAALVVGVDPKAVAPEDGSYQTVLTVMQQAIIARSLRAVIGRRVWERGWDEDPGEGETFTRDVTVPWEDDIDDERTVRLKRRGVIYRADPDWDRTMIRRANLVAWLEARGHRTGFFFPDAAPANDVPGYLDPTHPRYAPRLAAAIRAWEAVADTNGKSPKQAIVEWLTAHAPDYGLVDRYGRTLKLPVEEISKVANWQPDGGAPKTPTD